MTNGQLKWECLCGHAFPKTGPLPSEETLPIRRTAITDMVVAYREAVDTLTKCHAMLTPIPERLNEAFMEDKSYRFDLKESNSRDGGAVFDLDSVLLELKKDAWQSLVTKMDIRKLMSMKRAAELDDQLQKPKELPDITEVNILAMMEQTFNQFPAMMEEAVKEVYRMLMPRSAYKTNSQWAVGKRVILGYKIEGSYSQRSRFQVRYDAQKELTALDNVFLMMDGKGVCKSHKGPLCDAIEASQDGLGETEYFKFKCYINRNMHLEFRRPDLVERLNQIAGGGALRRESPNTSTQMTHA
jgi:hypothetical protein